MTARERKLAMLVGVWPLSLFYTLVGQPSIMDSRRRTRRSMAFAISFSLIKQQSLKVHCPRKKINEYATRSLPSNVESAKTIYSAWLIKFAEESKLAKAKLTMTGESANVRSPAALNAAPTPFTVLNYSLDGQAKLDDVVGLLYRFYSHPYLHRINNLKLTLNPKEEYGTLDVVMTISVAVLKDAAPDQAAPKIDAFKLLARSVDDYHKTIVQKNIFYPANRPPAWSNTASTSTNIGSALNYELTAKDPDEKQSVRYELVDSTAEGLKLEGNRLVWSPKENGKYEVTVRAIDSGFPSASTEQKIAVNVTDPPPPPTPEPAKPKFDVATQTRVTGLVSGSKDQRLGLRIISKARLAQCVLVTTLILPGSKERLQR